MGTVKKMPTKTLERIRLVATIIGVVADMKENGAPSGIVYSGLMVGTDITFDEYMDLIQGMIRVELIIRSGNLLKITPSGQDLADRFDKVMEMTDEEVKAKTEA